jgi:hypothetical protein
LQLRNGCDKLFHINLGLDALGNPRIYDINRRPRVTINNIKALYSQSSLCFHASFSDNPYGYVCQVNESYHKLVKKYPLLYGNFEIWFTVEGGKKYLDHKYKCFY